MEVIEIIGESQGLTLRQRWANVFTIVLAVVLMVLGLNLRNQAANATALFDNPQAGITAFYPLGWLLDTSGEYVFRVRDMSRSGFKTVFQIAIMPVGVDAQERNVADRLTLDRLETFTDYRVQPLRPFQLPDGRNAQALEYTFVETQTSPFLTGIPTVVRGVDLLIISGDQAVIITYRAEVGIFDDQYAIFQQFLRSLSF